MRGFTKRRWIILSGVLGLLVSGIIIYCFNKPEADLFSLDRWYCPSCYTNFSYSDKGIFRMGEEGIMYLDAATGKEVSICTKAGCTHEDEECPARVDALYITGIVYDGTKLYYVSSSGEQEFKSLNLTECDVNGTNRKKIADFPEIQTPTAVSYYGDYVIVAYRNGFDIEKKEEVANREAGVFVYNKKTNEGKKIYSDKAWGNDIVSVDIIKDSVYFSRTYSSLSEEEIMQQSPELSEETADIELYKIPLAGGVAECIGHELSTSVAGVSQAGDMVLYSTTQGIQAYSIKSGKTKSVMNGKNYSIVTDRLAEQKAIIQRFSMDDNVLNYYLVDDKGKVSELGQTSYLLLAVFDSVTYAMDEAGEYVMLDTEKIWKKEYKTVS